MENAKSNVSGNFCVLSLSDVAPLAESGNRTVYPHPVVADWLIKVVAPNALGKWRQAHWYKRRRRTGPYRIFASELKEFLVSSYKARGPSPIARVVGLADTDVGLGLVVDKVSGAGGGLAPTLDVYVRRNGLTRELREQLEALYQSVLEHEIIVEDIAPENIVLGSDSYGGPRPVIVDGFGQKTLISFCALSRRYNARNTRHEFQELYSRLHTLAAECK